MRNRYKALLTAPIILAMSVGTSGQILAAGKVLQTPGGGGTGGGSGNSNWSIQYSYAGSTTVTTPNSSISQSWNTGKSGGMTSASVNVANSSVSTSGTVTATVTWIGIGTAPASVNLDVTAVASAGCASGSASDGYGDSTQFFDILGQNWWSQSGTHLKTVGVQGGQAVLSLSLSASGTSNVTQITAGATVSMSVAVDNRYAYISLPGISNYKEQATGHQLPLNVIYHPDYKHLDITATKTYQYPEAVPALNSQILPGSNPLTSGGTLYIGLPIIVQQESDSLTGPIYKPATIADTPVAFQANVLQLFIPNESYVWTSDQGGPSESLPGGVLGFGQGWNILLCENSYNTPYVSSYTPILGATELLQHDGASSGFVGLSYKWNDGVQATCQDSIQFHAAKEFSQSIYTLDDLDPSVGWTSMNIQTASGWSQANVPQQIPWELRDWQLQAPATLVTLALAGGSALDPPYGIPLSVIAALYGIYTSAAPPLTTSWTLSAPSESAFEDASANGRVSGTPPGVALLIQSYDWKADAMPLSHKEGQLSDLWGMDGYEGQLVTQSVSQYSFQSCFAGAGQPTPAPTSRFWFQYDPMGIGA